MPIVILGAITILAIALIVDFANSKLNPRRHPDDNILREIRKLRHEDTVTSVAFSLNNRFIITSSHDRSTKIWDISNESLFGKPILHGDWVRSAEISPDGKYFVTTCDDGFTRVWDFGSQTLIRKISHIEKYKYNFPSTATFSPCSKYLLTNDRRCAEVWRVENGEQFGNPIVFEEELHSAKFSSDGKLIVTCGYNELAQIWSFEGRKKVGPDFKHTSTVYYAELSPNGKYLLTTGRSDPAQLWDANSGSLALRIRHDPANEYVQFARFGFGGDVIITSGGDRVFRIWDLNGKELTDPIAYKDHFIDHPCFSPDGRLVAFGLGNIAMIMRTPQLRKLSNRIDDSLAGRNGLFSANVEPGMSTFPSIPNPRVSINPIRKKDNLTNFTTENPEVITDPQTNLTNSSASEPLQKADSKLPTAVRTWKSIDGRKTMGQVIEVDQKNETVTLRLADGRVFYDFPIEKFSVEDQRFLLHLNGQTNN